LKASDITTGTHPKHCLLQRSLIVQEIRPVVVASQGTDGLAYTAAALGLRESTEAADAVFMCILTLITAGRACSIIADRRRRVWFGRHVGLMFTTPAFQLPAACGGREVTVCTGLHAFPSVTSTTV